MKLDAVVISSNSMEEEVAARAADLERAGVEVVRLYAQAQGAGDWSRIAAGSRGGSMAGSVAGAGPAKGRV